MSSKSVADDKNEFASPRRSETICDMPHTLKQSRKTSCAKLAPHFCASQTDDFLPNLMKIALTRRWSEFYRTIDAQHVKFIMADHIQAQIMIGGRFLWGRRTVLWREAAFWQATKQRVSKSQLQTRKKEGLILRLGGLGCNGFALQGHRRVCEPKKTTFIIRLAAQSDLRSRFHVIIYF